MKREENCSPLVFTPLTLQEAFQYLVLRMCLQNTCMFEQHSYTCTKSYFGRGPSKPLFFTHTHRKDKIKILIVLSDNGTCNRTLIV